ncbi:hypothetical protein M0805_005000 [Coniferiporia weirii]|nr:hypothetical protein M0805_005000 [Coniferiporia weirii]
MRVLAFFSEARDLAKYLKTLFVVESVFMLGILIGMCIKEKISAVGAEGFAFCGNNSRIPPRLVTLYWTAPFSFEFVLMFLALYKAAEFWRASARFKGLTLVRVLIQDQVVYFVLVMVCSAAHITVFWVDQRGSPSVALNIFEYILSSTTLPCIVGCRLLMHLNEAAEKGVNGGTSYRLESISDMQFS